MSLTQPPIPAVIFPSRKIGPIETYLTIEELLTDQLEITEHPIQTGGVVTDHAYLRPSTAVLRIQIAQTEEQTLQDQYTQFLALQSGRIPFDLVVGKRVYDDMLIRTLTQATDLYTETVLFLQIELMQIRFVAIAETGAGVAPAADTRTATQRGFDAIEEETSRQADPARNNPTTDSGTRQPTQETPGTGGAPPRRQSVLRRIFGDG